MKRALEPEMSGNLRFHSARRQHRGGQSIMQPRENTAPYSKRVIARTTPVFRRSSRIAGFY